MVKIHSRHLNKCMRVVTEHCEQNRGIWVGDSLSEFCSDEQNMNVLKALSAQGNIKIQYYDNAPGRVSLQNEGRLYFLKKEEKWKERLYGFIAGVLTTAVAELIAWGVIHIITC